MVFTNHLEINTNIVNRQLQIRKYFWGHPESGFIL